MRLSYFIIFCLLASFAAAQDKAPDSTAGQPLPYLQMCEVWLRNGERFKGEVKEDKDSSLVLILKDKQLKRFSKKDIVRSEYYFGKLRANFSNASAEQHIGGSFYGASRNAFLFVPRKAEVNTAFFLLYNYNYNFSKNYSLGITTSLFLTPLMLHAKAHYQLATKAFIGFEAYAGISSIVDPVAVQCGALKFTLGDYNAHLTVGGAIAGGDGDLGYAWSIAGSKRLAGDVYAVAELASAYAMPGAIFTCGIRTVARPRISWLWGIGALVGEAARHSFTPYVIPFPYFGFSYRQ